MAAGDDGAGISSSCTGTGTLLEVDSLWEQIHILLLDYVSNTLYPRQIHVYEAFEEETDAANSFAKGIKGQCGEKRNRQMGRSMMRRRRLPKECRGYPINSQKEEEKIFQEVLSDFLG